MIVQYVIDYWDYVSGEITGKTDKCPVSEPKLKRELYALRQLIFLEQLGNWDYACTPHLWTELNDGNPTQEQRESYPLFKETWEDSGWIEAFPLDESEVRRVESALGILNLNHTADLLHIAEAVVLKASWFLTNDNDIITKCKGKGLPLNVCRPSESLGGISRGLFLK